MLDLLLAVEPSDVVAPGGAFGAGLFAMWAVNRRKNGNGKSTSITKTLIRLEVTLEFMLVELRAIRSQRE